MTLHHDHETVENCLGSRSLMFFLSAFCPVDLASAPQTLPTLKIQNVRFLSFGRVTGLSWLR